MFFVLTPITQRMNHGYGGHQSGNNGLNNSYGGNSNPQNRPPQQNPSFQSTQQHFQSQYPVQPQLQQPQSQFQYYQQQMPNNPPLQPVHTDDDVIEQAYHDEQTIGHLLLQIEEICAKANQNRKELSYSLPSRQKSAQNMSNLNLKQIMYVSLGNGTYI